MEEQKTESSSSPKQLGYNALKFALELIKMTRVQLRGYVLASVQTNTARAKPRGNVLVKAPTV